MRSQDDDQADEQPVKGTAHGLQTGWKELAS